MKGDFSRNTFDPGKHFARVLMQQGRVQLDADWNEQVAIFWHYLHTLAEDLIGPHGGPKHNLGFKITPNGEGGFKIGNGRYYVHGLLCENDNPEVTYLNQPYYPDPPDLNFPCVVYLDVWERHITYIEDDDIREKALGINGPDTATRSQIVWQVKTIPIKTLPKEEILNDPNEWEKLLQKHNLQGNQGKLKAKARETRASDDACITAPDARYRGVENQLYRVEIHRGSLDEEGPTFKWSRDNGAVVFPVVQMAADTAQRQTTVTLERLGRDGRTGLAKDDWVELVDDKTAWHNKSDNLLQVIEVQPIEGKVILKGIANSGLDEAKHCLLRRWDHEGGSELGITIDVPENKNKQNWIELENGIQICFSPGTYRTGDYWLVPARVATGDVEWPEENGNPVPKAMLPHGIVHYYAPLAGLEKVDDSALKNYRIGF
ncbi:MAG: hypothetical protein D6816_19455 [Bacteroidetes bacterium]|nr:MAG: hypothetical protein D6816_19455 [Bacteroidota bacterium]